MLQSLYSLGQYRIDSTINANSSNISAEKEEQIKNTLDILPKAKGSKKQMVVYIKLKKENDAYIYDGIGYDELDHSKPLRYLYKKGSPHGGDQTFISKITDIEKTFNRIFLPFDKLIKYYKNNQYTSKEFESLRKCVTSVPDLYEKVKSEVKTEVTNSSDQCDFLTFKIYDNNGVEGSRYINEMPELQNYFYEICVTNDDKKYENSAENKSCCVCHKVKKVFGKKAFPFSFYTIDKPGFITGGFNEENSWKNLPICGSCADIMAVGQKMAEESLRFSLCGQSYLLMPKFHNQVLNKEIIEMLCDFSKKLSIADRKDYNAINALEEDVIEILGNNKDYINSTLVFFEKQNSAFRVLLLIEDILPTRFKELYAAKVETTQWSKNYRNDDKFLFSFRIVKNFFSGNKEFFEVLSKIFYSQNIDYRLCVRNIMEKVRQDFSPKKIRQDYNLKKENNAHFTILNGLAMLKFFFELGLFKNKNHIKGDELMQEINNISQTVGNGEEYSQKQKKAIEDFFNSNKDFFDSAMKKAIFLLGALTKKLLNIQSRDRNATPFYEHLKGLKMGEKDIMGMLPKIQNKLNEYKKNYYQAIETIISAYFIESKLKFNMSCDEINFYFTLGMNLHKNINVTNEENEELEGANK